MTLREATIAAKKASLKDQCVYHVGIANCKAVSEGFPPSYKVTGWHDDATIRSFENGRQLS